MFGFILERRNSGNTENWTEAHKEAIITKQTQWKAGMAKRGWIQEATEKSETKETETGADSEVSDQITNVW